jgi:hypothetical protein
MAYFLVPILDTQVLEPILARLEAGYGLSVANVRLLSRLLLLHLEMTERLTALALQLTGKPAMN